MASAGAVEVQAGEHVVRISSPDRIVFPEVGVTKLEVVEYFIAVGAGIVRALRHRPTTLERWPAGLGGTDPTAFFQKRAPNGRPEFVATARITFPSGNQADEVCPDSLAVVAWAANLGTLTFHPWPVRQEHVDNPDELRIDLDPQPGTTFAAAAIVALELKALLQEHGMIGFPKSSGGRGLHVYVRLEPRWDFVEVRHAAIALGRELERRMPGRVTTNWWKEERGETIFVDYNQNARDRTIASAYSVRPRPNAPVSMPLLWPEVSSVGPGDFTVRTAPARFASVGDAHAAIDDVSHDLTPLLEMYESDITDRGLGDLPYPPEYPKMAGEPKRVQPSRDTDRRKAED
jgi:DNA ligase D